MQTHVNRYLPVIYAPCAGSVKDDLGAIVPLLFRYNSNAVTADGRLILIDRPEEWPDGMFPSWRTLSPDQMNAEQMAAACSLLELMLLLPKGTLSADSLAPSLKVAAACCNGTLQQFQRLACEP